MKQIYARTISLGKGYTQGLEGYLLFLLMSQCMIQSALKKLRGTQIILLNLRYMRMPSAEIAVYAYF